MSHLKCVKQKIPNEYFEFNAGWHEINGGQFISVVWMGQIHLKTNSIMNLVAQWIKNTKHCPRNHYNDPVIHCPYFNLLTLGLRKEFFPITVPLDMGINCRLKCESNGRCGPKNSLNLADICRLLAVLQCYCSGCVLCFGLVRTLACVAINN